jgi:hypothetical protein
MKAILTMLAGAALCVAAQETAVTSKYMHVPLLMWSSRSMFTKQDAYVNSVLDESKVSEMLKNVLNRDTTDDSANVLSHDAGTDKAELLCLFLSKNLDAKALGQLSADGTSFVESAAQDSKSSVVLPHTTRDGALQDALKEAQLDAPVVDDVDAWLKSDEGKKLLSNDKTDLVIVEIPKAYTMSQADELIKTVSGKFTQAGKTDFAFTGNEAETIVTKTVRSRRLASTPASTLQCDPGYVLDTDARGKQHCFGHYVRITPDVLSALVVIGIFLFLSYVGFTQMHQIQTPQRYPHHGPAKGKEF